MQRVKAFSQEANHPRIIFLKLNPLFAHMSRMGATREDSVHDSEEHLDILHAGDFSDGRISVLSACGSFAALEVWIAGSAA